MLSNIIGKAVTNSWTKRNMCRYNVWNRNSEILQIDWKESKNNLILRILEVNSEKPLKHIWIFYTIVKDYKLKQDTISLRITSRSSVWIFWNDKMKYQVNGKITLPSFQIKYMIAKISNIAQQRGFCLLVQN